MNPDFKSRQIKFSISLIGATLLLFAIHAYLLHYFARETIFFFPIWQIYAFLAIITFVFYTIINYRHSKGKKEVFNIFMGGTLLKMVLSIVFLLPLILSDFENKQSDVFNFFIPYFLFLFFEVYALTSFLQKG